MDGDQRAMEIIQFLQANGDLQRDDPETSALLEGLANSDDRKLEFLHCLASSRIPPSPRNEPDNTTSCHICGSGPTFPCITCRKKACRYHLWDRYGGRPMKVTESDDSGICETCNTPRLTELKCGVCDNVMSTGRKCDGCGLGFCRDHSCGATWCSKCEDHQRGQSARAHDLAVIEAEKYKRRRQLAMLRGEDPPEPPANQQQLTYVPPTYSGPEYREKHPSYVAQLEGRAPLPTYYGPERSKAMTWNHLGLAVGETGCNFVTVNGQRYTKVQCYEEAAAVRSDATPWSNLACTLSGNDVARVSGKLYQKRDCCIAGLEIDPYNSSLLDQIMKLMSVSERVDLPTHGLMSRDEIRDLLKL